MSHLKGLISAQSRLAVVADGEEPSYHLGNACSIPLPSVEGAVDVYLLHSPLPFHSNRSKIAFYHY